MTKLFAMCVFFEQKCELRKRTGIAGIWDSIVTKVNTPFQPDVPNFDIYKDSQTHVHFKTLKHPFIRDKLHLWVPELSHKCSGQTHPLWESFNSVVVSDLDNSLISKSPAGWVHFLLIKMSSHINLISIVYWNIILHREWVTRYV